MKKLKLFFALFAMLALGVTNAWAETVVYTLTPAATGGNSAPHNSYTAGADFTCDEITWNITGNSSMVPWRIGGKNINNTERTLYSKTAMQHKVTKVEVKHGTNNATVNSFKLIVSSDANFSNVISTVDGTFNASATATLTCPSGDDWSNAYYKFVYKVTVSGNSNKFLEFSEAKFYGEASTTPDPTPDPEGPDPTPGTGSSTGWVETAIANIASSDLVVVTMTSSSGTYAMSNDKGTGAAPVAVKVTVNGDKLSDEPADNLKWNITYSSGSLTIYPNGDSSKWLYCTGTNNGTRVGTNANKTFTIDGTYLKHTGTSRYVGVYNNQDWRCYTSSSTNIGSQTLKFYKYIEQSSEGGGSEETAPSLTTDQFSWSATTATATLPNTFDNPPTLTNTENLEVTYSSSNEGVAKIDANGNVTLVGVGTADIKATAGDGVTFEETTVAYTLTVLKAPATPTSTVYVKVTSTEGVTNGEYLIVYEEGKVAFNGALTTLDAVSNTIEVEITDGKIAGTNYIDDAVFTIDATEKTIKSASGKYIGRTAYDNGLDSKTEVLTNTIEISEGNAVITASGNCVLRYNKTSGQDRFRYFKSGQEPIALYKKASSHTLTYGTCTNGSVSANVADGATVLSGTTITLSNTPATGNKLAAYNVYKTGEETTKVTVDGNTFVMPEFDVTISATFVPAKTLASIEITSAATQTTFWQGETFNYTGLEVTAHFDGAADEVVTPTVTGSTATAGTQTVTVSYKEGAVSKDATYTITVKAIPNTKETAYSVADAYDIIDKLGTASGVFISGIISQVDSYNSTYKSITYWISADGTTTNQLQAYSGKGLEGADFTAVTDVAKGAQVIVCGNLKKHNTTYEFDYNNYLAAYTAPTKAEPGIAYETTEYTANVNEAFTAPTLTNPNGLTVAYSTSDATLATVDATTGAVTILDKAGKVTITATFDGNAAYLPGTASYNITITDPSLVVATLPFAFNGNKAAIETTAGMTQNGLGSDYSASTAPNSQLKFDGTGDWVVIRFDSEPEKLSYDIKNNSFSGGKFSVQESADGETYTDVAVHITITDLQSEEYELNSASRYVKFIYTTKSSGNVGLGNISITKADHRQEAGLAWNPATISLTVDDAFTAPTFSNPNSLTVSFESSNTALATVNNAGEISLVSGKTGTATITATFEGDDDYKAAEVKCTISVNPKTNKVVILAEYEGEWYALKAEYLSDKTDRLVAVPVDYFNGTLYNVAEEVKATIEWNSMVEGDKVSFINDGKYLKGKSSTTLLFEAGEDGLYQWDNTNYTMTIGTSVRSFLYNGEAFRNFAISNAGQTKDGITYSELPVVTAPVYVNLNTSSVKTVEKGVFSVGNGKFVQFSTGNLQYEVGTNTWSFASEQYEVIGQDDYIGSNNTNYGMNEPGYTGKLDLFGWSSDGKFGVNPSNADADYGYAATDFVDWGNLVNETGWYTLTKDEMNYLLNRKKDGKKLWALATVCGMNGLILLPDNWNKETELEYGYVPADWNYTKNQFDDVAWAALEAAGAVFLPEGGTRVGGHGNKDQGGGPAEFDAHYDYFHVDNVGSMGYYWLNTQDTRDDYKNCASYLILPGWSKGATDADNDDICLQPQVWSREKRRGNSVRLVKKVTPNYTREVRPGYYGTICLENGGQMIGASLFELSYYNEAQGLLYMDEAYATMVAGNPYVFLPNERATNNTLYVFYDETTPATEAGTVKGLVGSFGEVELPVSETDPVYIMKDNKIKKVVGANVFVSKNRAYIKLGSVNPNEQAPVPGRRRVAIGQAPQVATGMESVDASAQPVKMIINGQLYILRGEKMYDAQGKLVK